MAIGKNKKLGKKGGPATAGGKGGKKKIVDPFAKKEWYDVKVPSFFTVRNVGKTVVSRTAGTKIASDALKGRIFTVNLGDLNKVEDQSFRNMLLRADDVQGRSVLTNFYGMDMTSDKLHTLIRKWQTMIEAQLDVSTTDGYRLRLFAIAFTKRRPDQRRKTTYAQHSQIRQIRKKMFDIMAKTTSQADLKQVVAHFVNETMGKEMEKSCQGIFPIKDVYIRKVKVLRAPKYDPARLMELHGDTSVEVEVGAKVDRLGEEKAAEMAAKGAVGSTPLGAKVVPPAAASK